MRSLRPYVVGLFLLALSATPAFAAPSSAADAARAEHDRVARYWTPARLAAAQPRDFVRTSTGFQPYAGKPGGGGGAVTGASWTGGGAVSKTEGKVYFHMDGGDWQCSGTAATGGSGTYTIVLTAGHCAYDETNGGGKLSGFATNWIFIPAWDLKPGTFSSACDAGATSYGCWHATALVVDSGFANAGGFNNQATRHDFAFAVVGGGGFDGTTALSSVVTPFAVSMTNVTTSATVYAFGFPAAGKYHGNDLTYCSGTPIKDQYNDNDTFGLACDMTGGSSGGGWMAPFTPSTGVGTLGGLNSYGYSGIKNMYGPDFNSNTDAVYTRAKGTTSGNSIVTVSP
jgi:hypothetical protein